MTGVVGNGAIGEGVSILAKTYLFGYGGVHGGVGGGDSNGDER